MKKKIFLMIAFMVALITPVFCQVTDGSLSDALAALGISPALAWAIVAVLGVVVGHFGIPEKWASPLAWVQKILQLLVTLLDWANEKTNKLSAKQKAVFVPKYVRHSKIEELVEEEPVKPTPKKKSGKAVKMLMVGIILSACTIGASAQGTFKPLKDVVTDKIEKKVESNLLTADDSTSYGTFLLRFSATALGTKYNFRESGLVKTPFSQAGFGATWSHYVLDGEGNPFNNYGFGAYLLFPAVPLVEDPTPEGDDIAPVETMSIMVDASVMQLFDQFTFSVGLGYDFKVPEGTQFVGHFFVAPGVKITF